MNGQIFICYRREDSLGSTGRLYDRLLEHFTAEQVFIDVDTILPGDDFAHTIEKAIGNCDILVAVIGRDWLNINKNGGRMLDDPADFVRTEIRTAVEKNVWIIPVLVENAQIPQADDLPPDIRHLARRNAIEISHTRFNADTDKLIRALQKALQIIKQARIADEELARQKAREQLKRLWAAQTNNSRIKSNSTNIILLISLIILASGFLGLILSAMAAAVMQGDSKEIIELNSPLGVKLFTVCSLVPFSVLSVAVIRLKAKK
ncbi:MAG: toll/interleukin-1 receptor domain-containing protein [Chitinophagaceae bacterium]